MTATKTTDIYNVILDKEEQEIEDSLNFDTAQKESDVSARIATFKKAATSHLRKDKQINIRLTQSDLLRLKEAAADEGLPYQTLIASVLHKYAVGQNVQRS